MRNILCLAAALTLVTSLGCGKAEEKAAEKTLETSIENSLGGESDVDISDEGMKVTSQDEDGTYTWQAGSEAEVPGGFPSDVYVFKGAEVEMSSDSPDSFVLALKTDAAFAKVVEAYKTEMPSAGWTEMTATQMDGAQMLVYSMGDRAVNVGVFDEDGATKISLSVSK